MRPAFSSIIRTLDANFNRTAEAVRVVEDILRFQLDDATASERAKNIRHDINSLRHSALPSNAVAYRDTVADVGTTQSTNTETRRADTRAVLGANFGRLAEGLRVIEENLKISGLSGSEMAKGLRYRAYVLETDVLALFKRDWLENANLMVLYDPLKSPHDSEKMAKALAAAGNCCVQLRMKDVADGILLRTARKEVEVFRGEGIAVIVNDRPDICALSDADGLHLGTEDLPVADAVKMLPAGTVIGASTHSVEDIARVKNSAAYIGAGPCFPSQTKSFADFPGPEFARYATENFDGPVFAIGGVNSRNVSQLADRGIKRVAVASAVCGAEQPQRAAEELLSQLRT